MLMLMVISQKWGHFQKLLYLYSTLSSCLYIDSKSIDSHCTFGSDVRRVNLVWRRWRWTVPLFHRRRPLTKSGASWHFQSAPHFLHSQPFDSHWVVWCCYHHWFSEDQIWTLSQISVFRSVDRWRFFSHFHPKLNDCVIDGTFPIDTEIHSLHPLIDDNHLVGGFEVVKPFHQQMLWSFLGDTMKWKMRDSVADITWVLIIESWQWLITNFGGKSSSWSRSQTWVF